MVLVRVWFGSEPNQTKTKPKPNQNQTKTKPKPYQNHTKTIPQKSTGFWYGFEAEPASNLNQKCTKNQCTDRYKYELSNDVFHPFVCQFKIKI